MATAFLDILMRADNKQFRRSLKQSERDVKRYSFLVRREFKQVATSMARSAAIGVGALAALSKASIDNADNFAKAARNAHLALDDYQRLAHAFELGGSSAEALTKVSAGLARKIFDLERNSSEAADAFDALGLRLSDLQGLSRGDQLNLVLQRLRGMTDASRQAGVAQVLLGRAGREVGTILNESSEEFLRVQERLDSLGGVIETRLLNNAERFNDEMLTLTTVLRAQFTSGILEAIGATQEYDETIRSAGLAARELGSTFINAIKFVRDNATAIKRLVLVYAAYRLATSRLLIFTFKWIRAVATLTTTAGGLTAALNLLRASATRLLAFLGVGGAFVGALLLITDLFFDIEESALAAGDAMNQAFTVAQLENYRRELAKIERELEAMAVDVDNAFISNERITQLETRAKQLREIIDSAVDDDLETSFEIPITIDIELPTTRQLEERILEAAQVLSRRDRLGADRRAAFIDSRGSFDDALRRQQRQRAGRFDRLGADRRGAFQDSIRAQDFLIPDLDEQINATTTDLAETFTESLRSGFRQAFRDGDFSSLGDVILQNLANTFTDRIADNLADLVGDLFENVFASIGSGGGGGGGFLSSLFGFHQGGVVPGSRGQEVPALLEAGELVLTEDQQRMGLGGVTNNITLVGNVDRATQRAVRRMMPEIASGVTQIQREQRAFG